MKPFRFQQFEIHQSSDVFRVGTDAVLIGVLSNVVNAKQILEVGTGTGIISLMLAQRNANIKITFAAFWQDMCGRSPMYSFPLLWKRHFIFLPSPQ